MCPIQPCKNPNCKNVTMIWYCATNFDCYGQYTLKKSKDDGFKKKQDHNRLCKPCAMNEGGCCPCCPFHPPPDNNFTEAKDPKVAKEFHN